MMGVPSTRDEEGAEGRCRRHGESDVGGDELPVGLPDGVDRFDCAACMDAGDARDGTHDGEDR